MRLINLLPPFQIKQVHFELVSIQLKKFWIWVCLSLLILFGLAFASQAIIKNEISNTGNKIINLSRSLQSSDNQKLERQVATLNNEIKNIEIIQNNHYFWSNALIELGNIIPSELVVSLLTLNRETGEVKIIGQSRERSAVLAFWANVKNSEYFQDINFPLSNLESDTEVGFTFTFFINEELIKQE